MSDNSPALSWYLAQLKPNSARIAERNLSRQGFHSFLPRIETTRRRAGRFITGEEPLFPGYIFVQIDRDRGGWRKVNSTQGITRLVSFGQAPSPVPLGLVDALRARNAPDGDLVAQAPPQPGDKVRVTRGAFAEFFATVEATARDRRVWILLDLMGREVRTALPEDNLCRA